MCLADKKWYGVQQSGLVRCEKCSEKNYAVDTGMETNLQGGESISDDELVVFLGEADSGANADWKRLKLTMKNSFQVAWGQDDAVMKWGLGEGEMIYQYYKGWVVYDLCVTQNYCLPSNPRSQSTWLIQDFKGGPPVGALQAQRYIIYELNFGM
jgi:hypothetical protein